MNALRSVHREPRAFICAGLPQRFDLNFKLLPFFGGDEASRLADLVLDLEDFRLLSGDLDSRRPTTHRIDQTRVLCWLWRLLGPSAEKIREESHAAGVATCRRTSNILQTQASPSPNV